MKVTVVVDNIGNNETKGEWGLCLYIEYNGKNFLLDTGASTLFAENMQKMGIDIKNIDYAILSHAHSDHAGGMPCFFESNQKADFYIQECCSENCYMKIGPFKSYQGIPVGTLNKYSSRIKRIADKKEISAGVFIISHTNKYESVGKAQHLYIKKENKYIPDDYTHEQSLVFKTEKGLIILNSCSHIGADKIIKEIKNAFPTESIYAIMGGFHFVAMPKAYVKGIAKGILETGIEKVYTGHCTKDKGFKILRNELGYKAEQFKVGMEITF